MKKTKRSLLFSGLALMMSALLLAGTTFAWFTDSVTNKGNTIQAGELDIGVIGYTLENGEWEGPMWENNLTNNPLFTETTWEPGQYGAILIRVSSYDTTLAEKVSLDFTITDNGKNLADALWYKLHAVQTVSASYQGAMLDALEFKDHRPASEADGVTTMSKIEEDATEPLTLYPDYHQGQYAYYVLEYGMYTSAGNEYQGGSFGLDFSVNATQAPYEEDGFGSDQYDKDAYVADFEVADTAGLENALNEAKDGDTIALSPNMKVEEPITVDKAVTVDGNGAEFTDKITVTVDGVVLKDINLNIPMTTVDQTAPISSNNKDLTLENCNITRTTQTAQPYGMLVNVGSGKLTAKNTVFTAPYDPDTAFAASPSVIEAGEVDLDGCVIATDGYGLFSQHVTTGMIKNTTFTGVDGRPTLGCFNSTLLNGLVFDGCTFEMGYNSIVSAGNFTIKNSTFDFTNTPENGAGNGVNIYAQNGPIVLENNTFNFSGAQCGINLTSASWAAGSHDASQVTIVGNTFNGSGAYAIKIAASDWENEKTADEYTADNTLNECVIGIN